VKGGVAQGQSFEEHFVNLHQGMSPLVGELFNRNVEPLFLGRVLLARTKVAKGVDESPV